VSWSLPHGPPLPDIAAGHNGTTEKTSLPDDRSDGYLGSTLLLPSGTEDDKGNLIQHQQGINTESDFCCPSFGGGGGAVRSLRVGEHPSVTCSFL